MTKFDKKTIGRDERKTGFRTSLTSLLTVVVLLGAGTVTAGASAEERSMLEDGEGVKVPGPERDQARFSGKDSRGGELFVGHWVSNIYADVTDSDCRGKWGTPESGGNDAGGSEFEPYLGTIHSNLAPITPHKAIVGSGTQAAGYLTPSGSTVGETPGHVGFALRFIAMKLIDAAFNYEPSWTLPGSHPWYVECEASASLSADCGSSDIGAVMVGRECIMQFKEPSNDEVHPGDPCHPEGSGAPWCNGQYVWRDISQSACQYGLLSGGGSQCSPGFSDSTGWVVVKEGVFSHGDEVPLEYDACVHKNIVYATNRPTGDEYNVEYLVNEALGASPPRATTSGPVCESTTVDWSKLSFAKSKECDQPGLPDGTRIYTFYEWDPNTGEAEKDTPGACTPPLEILDLEDLLPGGITIPPIPGDGDDGIKERCQDFGSSEFSNDVGCVSIPNLYDFIPDEDDVYVTIPDDDRSGVLLAVNPYEMISDLYEEIPGLGPCPSGDEPFCL